MKPLLCLLGIHKHEPIKRIRRTAIINQSGRRAEQWCGFNVPTCVKCGHKKSARIITEPMSRAKAEGWKTIHSNLWVNVLICVD